MASSSTAPGGEANPSLPQSPISPSILASLESLASQTSNPSLALAMLKSTVDSNSTNATTAPHSPRATQDQLLKEHPTLAQMREVHERQAHRVRDAVEQHVQTKAECDQKLEELKFEWDTYTRLEKKLKERKEKTDETSDPMEV